MKAKERRRILADTANRWSLDEGISFEKGFDQEKVSFGSSWKHRHFDGPGEPARGGRSYPVLRYFKLARLELKGTSSSSAARQTAVQRRAERRVLRARREGRLGPQLPVVFRVPATEQDADGLVGEWMRPCRSVGGSC